MSDPAAPAKPKKDPKKTPQELLGDFWEKFVTKTPGKVTNIFPKTLYAQLLPPLFPQGVSTTTNAAESYEAAAKECRDKVKRIVRECNRTNEKFTDPDFDLEGDKNYGLGNCLQGLDRYSSSSAGAEAPVEPPSASSWELKDALSAMVRSRVVGTEGKIPMDIQMLQSFIGADAEADSAPRDDGDNVWFPGSVHRLDWIFENPQFVLDGFSSSDIKQGANGDCWWLAAVATICNRKDLMEKVCVARDEECGVYGFVFFRDGDWISTVVDDNLYLNSEDFDYYGDEYDSTGKKAREYRKRNQTGSEALNFAKCEDPNETWLPLLEKAYAKVHGDYEAISGGWSGEGVEDMTGGVTTTIATNRVLRKDKLWKELVNASGEFVFAASAIGTGWDWKKGGLALGHAYSVLKAVEVEGENGEKVRLVQIRNPWGQRAWNGIGEWNGPWSDGSKEWTPYWMKKLNHTFGDDGLFWMTYEDMRETFLFLHRTRLFDESWTVIQRWTSANIAWVTGYLKTKFIVELKKGGNVVIVLSQLDERYFRALEGQYKFELHFIVREVGAKPSDYLVRVRPVHAWESRSVSAELDLEAGKYEVLPKIVATRDTDNKVVEDVVRDVIEKNPQKLRQVGLSYDLAHAKGGVPIGFKSEEDKKAEKLKKKKKAAKKAEKEKEEEKKEEEKKEEQKTEEKKEETKEEKKEEEKAEEKKEEEKKEEEKTEGKKEEEKKDETKDEVKEEKKEETKTEEKEEVKNDKADEKKEDEKKDEKEEKKEEEEEEESDEEEEEEEAEVDETAPQPWNAICVIGLRVYAKDSQATITLVEPKNAEEASLLDPIGDTPAGATV